MQGCTSSRGIREEGIGRPPKTKGVSASDLFVSFSWTILCLTTFSVIQSPWPTSLSGTFPGAEKPEEEGQLYHCSNSILKRLTYEVQPGRQQDAVDIVHTALQVLRGHTGQGRMDRSAGAGPAPGKGKTAYHACLGAGQRPVPGTCTNQRWGRGRSL